MSHFNKPNMETKICVWITKCEKLSEMCIVQHVEMKSVFIFQPIKRLVSTTVKSAKPVATFSIFVSGTKSRQLCCLGVSLLCKKDESRVRKTISIFEEISPPITTKHNRTSNKKRLKRVQTWNKRIRILLVDNLSKIFIFKTILFNFNLQSTAQI